MQIRAAPAGTGGMTTERVGGSWLQPVRTRRRLAAQRRNRRGGAPVFRDMLPPEMLMGQLTPDDYSRHHEPRDTGLHIHQRFHHPLGLLLLLILAVMPTHPTACTDR